MKIIHKQTETPQTFEMKDTTLLYPNGDLALTACFEQKENEKGLMYQVSYYYPESGHVAAVKNFEMDGLLKQEACFSKKDATTTYYKSYRYKNGQLQSMHIKQNNNTQSIEPTPNQNILEKLLFGKHALLKKKDHERFHNEFSISAEDLFADISNNSAIAKHVNNEIQKAENYNKTSVQSKSHLRIAN